MLSETQNKQLLYCTRLLKKVIRTYIVHYFRTSEASLVQIQH